MGHAERFGGVLDGACSAKHVRNRAASLRGREEVG
jgi:hypothetical protein